MVFYLAILLILCGFLIVISALFIEISEAKKTEEDTPLKIKTAKDYRPVKTKSFNNFKSGSNKSGSNRPDDLRTISPYEFDNNNSIFKEFEDTFHDLSEPKQVLRKDKFDVKNRFHDNIDQRIKKDHRAAAKLNFESDIEITDSPKSNLPQNNPPQQKEKNNIVYAVMFDDRSDIIDYSSGVGTLDSTFLKYKDIKRIGKGIIESDSDGINFYLDEKLYRFDSHRIYDIWCGENYVALPLKGNGLVKLFIIENSKDFPYKVEADFKEFKKKS
jgi:hypothetical protein